MENKQTVVAAAGDR